MGEDPKLRFTIRAKKEKQRNEIDQRVDADEKMSRAEAFRSDNSFQLEWR